MYRFSKSVIVVLAEGMEWNGSTYNSIRRRPFVMPVLYIIYYNKVEYCIRIHLLPREVDEQNGIIHAPSNVVYRGFYFIYNISIYLNRLSSDVYGRTVSLRYNNMCNRYDRRFVFLSGRVYINYLKFPNLKYVIVSSRLIFFERLRWIYMKLKSVVE